jgi:GNAT superfamily N-acetyltransferase
MDIEPTASISLRDGYTELPAGKLAAVVTYLDMREPPRRERAPHGAPSWQLEPLGSDAARYLALYRRIGEPWLWFSRLAMPQTEFRGILEHADVEAFALTRAGTDIGLLELDFRTPGECELAFLGLVPEAIGRGAGRFLIKTAVARAFARPIRRLWVHTCTLDHPSALQFYMRAGFTPYRRAIEIADDPRLLGLLPRNAAPQAPLIER